MTNKKDPSLYTITTLEKKHNKNSFSCGLEALDRYLLTQASQDIKKNVAVAYVLTSTGNPTILGYYTLSSYSIFPGELPTTIIKKLPKYPLLPAILLGRLAVDTKHQKKKIGSFLLVDALKRSVNISYQIDTTALIVDAKDEKAADFYRHYGFIGFTENTSKLFLPIDTIKKVKF